MILHRPFALFALSVAAVLPAQTFQVVVCETPVGSGGGQPVERFSVAGTNGAATRIADMPGTSVDDPVALAFDNRFELFVGNRDAHHGNSTISRFVFDPTFTSFTQNGTIAGNAVTDAAQLAFDPVSGELFQCNFTGGLLSRFVFDAQGNANANGTVQMPDGANQLGVAIRPADQQLFVSSYTFVRRFARQANGSYVHLGDLAIPGATLIHFLAFRGDELYVCDIQTNAVHRFRFDAQGNPVANGSVPVTSAIGCAFSPDLEEMFVARHFAGGFQRLLYQAATDTWSPTTVVAGPQMGGIATTVHWFESYGSGCPGAGAVVPTLQGYGIPRPGYTTVLRTQLGVPGNFGILSMAALPGSVPVLGCTWLQSAHIGNTNLFLLDAAG
ncbi:MAG: hypothetical protein U1E73_10210, partial [Planctomycetota bacterium]